MPPEASLVSCVVPTFNAACYLDQALGSILGQSHTPIEVVVVDDGSKDDSLRIARSHGPTVRVVTQDRLGPAATRNRGVQEARGAFVAFLDPDDLWHPDKLRRQLQSFSDDPSLDLCLSHARLQWEPAVAEEAERLRHLSRATQPVPGFATTTLLARRGAFETVGLFDTSLWFADAVDWFMRAEAAGLKRLLLEEALTTHRMHGSNLTRRRSADSRSEFLGVVKRWADQRRAAGARSGEGASAEQPGLQQEPGGDRGPEELAVHTRPAGLPEAGAEAGICQQP